jgi:hypothetical protein
MAAGAWQVYGAAYEAVARGTIDLDSNTFRMVLVTSSYTPSVDGHSLWSSASGNEVANGGGYTTHGKLLAATVNRTAGAGSPSTDNVVAFDVDDQSWTSSTITAKYAIIVKDADANGALAAGDALICYCDLETGGGSVSTTNGTFAVTINAVGVFTITRT